MARAAFRGYNRVKFQSLKLGKTVFCQSLIVRDFLVHLEWDEKVISYELKPFKISVKASGRRRIINPHVLINYSDQIPTIVWLKPIQTDETDLSLLIKLLKVFCQRKGFNFIVKTPDEIRKEPFFSNLKFLRRYAQTNISFEHSILCREFFSECSTPTLGSLIHFFSEKGQSGEIAYALIFQKIVDSNIYSTTINFDSQIQLKNELPNFQNGRLAA